jgi:hypothetical protein
MSVFIPIADAGAARSFGSRPLAKPMRGADVRMLQRLLTDWGLPTAIDGQFGRHTKLRVRSWERNTDRRINGRMSRSEASALRAAVARGEHLPGYETDAVETPDSATEKATIGPDGLAIAPASAPEEVKAAIEAANRIVGKPYEYGGGHGRWEDSGYDCSGAMSYALHGAGLLDRPLTSGDFMSWGKARKGTWITIYAQGGHGFLVIAGLRFDTGWNNAGKGPRWSDVMRPTDGYTVRHPDGL